MTFRKNSASLLIAALSAITLAACNGGSSGGGGGTTTSGISGTGVAQGSVQRFGSIYVNGREFKTQNATFIIEGKQNTGQKDLNVGDIVTIKAEFKPNGTAVAKEVFFDAELEGPVTSKNTANNSFVVAGQTVLVNGTTVFAVDDSIKNANVTDFNFATMQKDQIVEISGRIDSSGKLHASSVELQATNAGASPKIEVTGTVSNLNTQQKTFKINNLKVDYTGLSGVQIDDGQALNSVQNGQLLEVTGTLTSRGVLQADNLELEDDGLAVEKGDAVEIESFVEAVNKSASTFTLSNGLTVSYGSKTVFEDGASAADITTGSAVEVEGKINAQGVLEAVKIELEGAENDPDVEVASKIKRVKNGEITLKVGGIMIDTTGETRIQISEELPNKQRDNFTVDNLQQGDYVEISAYNKAKDGQTQLVASLIEVSQAETTDKGDVEVSLQGHIVSTDKETDMFKILNTQIVVSGNTVEFKDANDNSLTKSEFFQKTAKGDLVEVSGTWTSSWIKASEVSLEGDDSSRGSP